MHNLNISIFSHTTFGLSISRLSFQTPEKAEKYKLSELKNGRLAMMAVSGALTQMGMTGHGFPFLG